MFDLVVFNFYVLIMQSSVTSGILRPVRTYTRIHTIYIIFQTAVTILQFQITFQSPKSYINWFSCHYPSYLIILSVSIALHVSDFGFLLGGILTLSVLQCTAYIFLIALPSFKKPAQRKKLLVYLLYFFLKIFESCYKHNQIL